VSGGREISVRPATGDDAEAIRVIWNHIIRDTYATFNDREKSLSDIREAIAARRADGHAFLVAECEGRVAGFAAYARFRRGPGYRHTMEHTIHLDVSFRGCGAGRALMAALEDHARARGVRSMIAAITGVNDVGQAFHAALGYERVACIPQAGFKAGRWFDLILMQKLL